MPTQRPTEPRYGWVLVAGGMLSMGLQSSTFFASAILLVAIPDDTGWSRTATATALSMLVLGSGLWAPIVGALVQRFGPRRAMTASALVSAAGLAAFGLARSPEELGAAMLLLISPGTLGVGSLANYAAIQAWFRERRGLALSVADTGASLGLVVVVPLLQHLILAFGWRAAVLLLACAVLLLAPLHLAIQRPAPDHRPAAALSGDPPDRGAGLLELLRAPRLWLVGLGAATSRFAFQLVIIHQAVYLTDQGFEAATVASALGLTGLAGLVGRPGLGWLSDRIGTLWVYVLLTACLLLAIGSLVAAGQSGLLEALWVFALSLGAVLGVGSLMFARQLSVLVGSRSFGGAMGLTQGIGGLGGTAGAALAGPLSEATGSYLSSFALAALMGVASLVCVWTLERSLGRAAAPA